MVTIINGALGCLRSVRVKWLMVVVGLALVLVSASFTPLVWAASSGVDSSSKLVTFYDDNLEKTIITKGATVQDALGDAGISINTGDTVSPGANTKLSNNMTIVNIRRARPVTVVDETGRRVRVVTSEVDNSAIAKAANINLQSHDTTAMTPIDDFVSLGGVGQQLTVTRAKAVNLTLYGQNLSLRTQQSTVRGMLNEAGITVKPNDTITVNLDSTITDGMSLQIWRNGIQTVEQAEEVPFETQVINDSTKKIGYHEIQTVGQVGRKTVIYQVNMRNGQEVDRVKLSEVVTTPAITQVEIKGTKVELPPGSHTDWMAMAGIPASDYGAANFIIDKESGWRYNASNPSGAYGLPQSLPGSKMASAGADWQTNPITQLRWFYSYCKQRYGSIQKAYDHWQRYRSY